MGARADKPTDLISIIADDILEWNSSILGRCLLFADADLLEMESLSLRQDSLGVILKNTIAMVIL